MCLCGWLKVDVSSCVLGASSSDTYWLVSINLTLTALIHMKQALCLLTLSSKKQIVSFRL